MSNNVTNHTFPGESWVLVPSVTPSEAKTSTQSSVDTTQTENKLASTPLIPLATLSDNVTSEIVLEETFSTEKFRETTFEPMSSEEQEDSSEYIGVTGTSSEDPFESEEDGTTTDNLETETININLTSSNLTLIGNDSNNH